MAGGGGGGGEGGSVSAPPDLLVLCAFLKQHISLGPPQEMPGGESELALPGRKDAQPTHGISPGYFRKSGKVRVATHLRQGAGGSLAAGSIFGQLPSGQGLDVAGRLGTCVE